MKQKELIRKKKSEKKFDRKNLFGLQYQKFLQWSVDQSKNFAKKSLHFFSSSYINKRKERIKIKKNDEKVIMNI